MNIIIHWKVFLPHLIYNVMGTIYIFNQNPFIYTDLVIVLKGKVKTILAWLNSFCDIILIYCPYFLKREYDLKVFPSNIKFLKYLFSFLNRCYEMYFMKLFIILKAFDEVKCIKFKLNYLKFFPHYRVSNRKEMNLIFVINPCLIIYLGYNKNLSQFYIVTKS